VGKAVRLPFGSGKLDKVFGEPIQSQEGGQDFRGRYGSSFPGWGSAFMGKTVLFECGNIKFLVSEFGGQAALIRRSIATWCRARAGKDNRCKNLLSLQHYRSMMKGAIMVDGLGLSAGTSGNFKWENVPRPLFPLDEISEWRATGFIKET